jgi:DNA-binding XRE family transcriptional regulator
MARTTTPERHPLRIARARKFGSIQALADASGVSYRTIYRIERFEVEPYIQTKVALADALGLSIDDLFPEDGRP